MSIATSRVTVTARDTGRFDAYLAVPASGRGPGLVLIQEIFGVNAYMRSVADGYAARGFTVICPDLFWRQQPGVELTDRSDEEWQQGISLMRGMDEALAVADCAAAMGFLRSNAACTGRVGALGFCLGGRLAWLLAVREDPDATVGYYGVGIENLLGEKHGLRAPLMLHIAGRDAYCPPEARSAIVEAIGGNPLVTLHTWADQDHAFSRPSGRHYDAAAAELADLRTLDFLCRHLSGPGSGPDLSAIWDEHVACEFAVRDTERTLATMIEDAYVNHVPVLTGGVGKEALRDFYSRRFIPKMPPDTSMTPVSRTVGSDRVVDEMIFRFTHTLEMDWMLPGIAPTGRRVEVPLVVIVHFRGGRLAHEHIYWDQATVLAQIGLLDAARLPVSGVESARKVLEPASFASNELIARASGRRGGPA
ncbi:MAG TPA: dienelactone hydrolase family protein [Candidatus Polarisedimenticolia bacterium]|nr:dienelactone hydrolase family protein [Candidatus Polarisedimenticolia bacterium]